MDLLVPLYGIPENAVPAGYWVGRPLPHQSGAVLDFVSGNFGEGWKAETSVALACVPPTLKVAVEESSGEIHGFCCWDSTAKGFLGPIGVVGKARKAGLGRSVVLSVLHSMREAGYAYAIIGGAGPVDFFQSICDARIIPGSEKGIYDNPIGKSSS